MCVANTKNSTDMISLLEEFGELSRLKPNLANSEVVFEGASNKLKEEMCAILGMEEGSLPLKYFGVPLISTKLRHNECQPTIDTIKKKIQG